MDDYISRQAAIDALDELCDRECEYSKQQRSVMCGACHLGSAFDVIEQLPSAQPERTGRWDRLMMYLADLQLTYSPNWGANGCGDEKLYEFVTGLIEELEGWADGGGA